MKSDITIVIVTRNRADDLLHCLASLLVQSRTVDNLVIIDNNSTDNTRGVVEKFSQISPFPISYHCENKEGHIHASQRGLAEVKTKWMVSLDDDCVADAGWYEAVSQAVENHSDLAAILGSSTTYFPKNIFALSKDFMDSLGRKITVGKDLKITDFEVLDSKNIIYNLLFIKENKIRFDEGLLEYGGGTSEDCDFGMQLQKAGGKAKYQPNMMVKHKDVNHFGYYRKLILTIKDHLVYEAKWRSYRDKKINNPAITPPFVLRELSKFFKKYRLNWFSSLMVALNVVFSIILIKLYRIYSKGL